MATAAANSMRIKGSDLYFALAAYKQGFHPDPNNPAKKVLRVRGNVASLKALWLDIDFKGQYADAREALTATKQFCGSSGVPFPSLIVSSGNGVHLYWPMDEALPLPVWQPLADALKAATKELELHADPACTSDACRVLRPPGSLNWKDPENPKRVELLYSSGEVFPYATMERVLGRWIGVVPVTPQSSGNNPSVFDEFTSGTSTFEKGTASFKDISTQCGVLKAAVESGGAQASEPEWVATLQILKHCKDGADWVHPVSEKHPGYTEAATNQKWAARLANTSGPTLCSTFESFAPLVCAICPHRGQIKSPIQIEVAPAPDAVEATSTLPFGWRVAPNGDGVHRLMVDPTTNEKEWVFVLRYVPKNLKATRSIVTSRYELQFDVEYKKSKSWSISLPGGTLGNLRKLCEVMADYGLVFKGAEAKNFVDLMATWLSKLQSARRVADVTEQLGWLIDGDKINGFSCGQTTFYADGRVRDDVRAAREFAAVSKYYEPKGGIEVWKRVAAFLTEQNNPAFTATLSAAFGAPLLRFTGMSGGILSIVSTASGVGKSSALKCSQAVWGSPIHGVNAVDDTPKSVARKIGFLNNLPAFWDELRGKKTVEDFLTLAFQITQGKERTRLDSSAQLREMQTWETMLVVASNESIFEAMARGASGSDAGVVRTYEIVLEPFKLDRNRAEISLLFEQLNMNYGHAGRVYAQYIATHTAEVEKQVQDMFTGLAQHKHMEAQERFWFAIMASLLVGADIANKLGLTTVDVRSLGAFLLNNVDRLRGRSTEVVMLTSPGEILAAFMQTYQDRALIVDAFPQPRQNKKSYIPDLTGGTPKADKIAYHVSREQRLLRLPMSEFLRWMEYRNLPAYTIVKRLKNEAGVTELRCKLGFGTRWELPSQRCLQVSLDAVDINSAAIDRLTAGDSSRPDDMSDSPSETPPEG